MPIANTTLDFALDYHRRGWSIIPIKPGEKNLLAIGKTFRNNPLMIRN